jgi:hypothetical protein
MELIFIMAKMQATKIFKRERKEYRKNSNKE